MKVAKVIIVALLIVTAVSCGVRNKDRCPSVNGQANFGLSEKK